MKTRRSNGTTLIEVVIGLVLLGALLVTLLVAAAKLELQKKRADEKLQSVRMLDSILEDCFSRGFPTSGKMHTIPGETRWNCSFEIVQSSTVRDPLSVVRVRIHSHARDESVLGMVDVLVHKENIGTAAW